MILLLVLLLLCGTLAVSTGILQSVSQRAVFLAKNADCLKCHSEVLASMTKASVHQPFLAHQCTSCHNEHSGLVTIKTTTSVNTKAVTPRVWFRWGPFRWWVSWFERIILDSDGEAQKVERQETLGEATLVATPRLLCWECHGNLGDERDMEFPHQPFATNNCLSCHDPHASDYEPLLNVSTTDLCVTCHPIGRELAREYTHPPVEDLACMDCHEAHASKWNGILVANQRDLCFTCHTDVAGQSMDAVQHGPFEGDNCTGCHEPHGSNYQPLLNAETPGLCYECHSSIEARYDRVSHHPVGTQIECESCHDPHASNYNGLLVLAQRSLCLSCHGEIAAMVSLSAQHAPFEEEPCTACHTPHGSDYSPLLRNPQPNLCYQCHPQVAVAMSRDSHHPEQCTRCHGVHATENEGLLVGGPGNSFCYGCHPTVAVSYLGSSHSVLPCLECHNPHGSRFGALRRHAPTELCSRCHNSSEAPHILYVGDGDISHRSTPHFYDIKAGKPLTCTSSCHNPHGSPYIYMMRETEWYYDGTCLPCHKMVGKTY